MTKEESRSRSTSSDVPNGVRSLNNKRLVFLGVVKCFQNKNDKN